MIDELKTIFEKVDSELFSEDVLQQISDLFSKKVEKTVEERVALEVENALKVQLEKFKKASKIALERIDEDHLNKIKTVIESVNKDHAEKLLIVKEKYDKIINESIPKYNDSLVESINEFVDLYLEKNIPKEMIAESARNKYALKQIEEARKVLGIDQTYIKDNIKQAVMEGKKRMDTLNKEILELKKAQEAKDAKALLLEKLSNLPANEAKFVRGYLQGKSPEFIKNNFKYIREMFKRSQKEQRRSELINESRKISNVDRNRVADELITENADTQHSNTDPMNVYVDALKAKK